MKRVFVMAATGLLLLASCSKPTDLYQPTPVEPVTPTPTEEPSVSTDDINANVQKVFGVKFDPNQDWSTTVNGQVKIIANSTIKKVQVLVYVSEINEEGETVTSMRIMNEADLNGETTITLNYDAPKDNLGIYVAFIDGNKKIFKKVEGNTVNIADAAKTRGEDWELPETLDLTLPTGDFKIAGSVESYASQRGWNSDEQLYYMNSYENQAMKATGYTEEYTQLFRAMIFSYFKNGRQYNNLPLVKASDYYNDKAYPFTTGKQPIIISPVYKSDKAELYGNEVWNSDLYYYYFKESDLENASDQVAFLKNLPKYKALAFKDYFGETEDDKIRKDYSYALLYYGDGKPNVDTKGTYKFPEGYKIGFMVRAKTEYKESDGKARKQGELYGDGRLNNDINNYSQCNFKSSKLGTDGPRLAYLSLNGRKYMCWESGTDSDFNDVIIEIECGLEIPEIPIEPEYNSYTYCFEDTELGDYDLNDVVIKAVRKSQTQVEYSIVACGAYDEIFVMNINAGKIKDNAEVHSLFGVSETKTFINTEKGGTTYQVTVTKNVNSDFSMADPSSAPYIKDGTTGHVTKMSKIGEDPHGIMIPNDFKYPLEKVCIKDAYKEFNNWGQNAVTSTDWYTKPVSGKVYVYE
jgi:hypothetical protein